MTIQTSVIYYKINNLSVIVTAVLLAWHSHPSFSLGCAAASNGNILDILCI